MWEFKSALSYRVPAMTHVISQIIIPIVKTMRQVNACALYGMFEVT